MPVSSKFELYTNKWPFSLSALFPLYIFSPDACLHSCVSSFRQGNRPAFNPVALLNGRVYHLPSTFALNGTLNPTGCTSRRFDLQPFQSDRIYHILVSYAPYTLMQQPSLSQFTIFGQALWLSAKPFTFPLTTLFSLFAFPTRLQSRRFRLNNIDTFAFNRLAFFPGFPVGWLASHYQ